MRRINIEMRRENLRAPRIRRLDGGQRARAQLPSQKMNQVRKPPWLQVLHYMRTTGGGGVELFDNNGGQLQLPFTFPQAPQTGPPVASALDRVLDPHALRVIDTQQPSNPNARVGSAQLLTNGNVGGFAIFECTPTGQEAAVPLETRNAPSYVLAFDNTGVLATGVAIANIATQPASIPVVIRDDIGVPMGTTVNLAGQRVTRHSC